MTVSQRSGLCRSTSQDHWTSFWPSPKATSSLRCATWGAGFVGHCDRAELTTNCSTDSRWDWNFVRMTESGGPKKITIHTDGACDGNPGPGGWAALLRYGDHMRELTGGEPATTNNRMELQAAICALAALKESCEITLFTDSEYLRQGITEWLPRWRANNWRTVDRKPVKNDDLWRQLSETTSRHRVTWQWLKGHVGHADNEHCDQLARAEVVRIRRQHSPEKLAALREAFIASRGPNRSQGSLL